MFKKIFGVLVLCMCVSFTFAFDIPAYDGYVTDKAGVLGQQEEQDLESQIFSLVKETSAQLGVLIIPSLEGEDIAMLAIDVGNKRGVGEEKYDNGIIMVISIQDRKWFIAVGYGLEGTIPDAIAKRVGEAQFPDNFRAGNYYEGIYRAINDIYGYIKNDPGVVNAYQNASSSGFDFGKIDPEFLLILIFVLAGAIGKFITSPDPLDKKKRKMTKVAWAKYGILGGIVSTILYFVIGTLIGAVLLAYAVLGIFTLLALSGFGGGGVFLGGRSGGSSFGGSSFGGFGGGSFGGGGGGGSW